jgi:hypothetical protein
MELLLGYMELMLGYMDLAMVYMYWCLVIQYRTGFGLCGTGGGYMKQVVGI